MSQEIRFTVTDGEKRSASWKCCDGPDDSVYLICRELKGAEKFSFHATGDWRHAWDDNFLNDEYDAGTVLPEKIIDIWERPKPLAPHVTLACRIWIPSAAVTGPMVGLPKGIVLIPAPELPNAIQVDLLVVDLDGSIDSLLGADALGYSLVGSFSLSNGESISLIQRTVDGIPEVSWTAAFNSFRRARQDWSPPYQLKILLNGEMSNGSRAVIECSISDEDAERIIASARSQGSQTERTPS